MTQRPRTESTSTLRRRVLAERLAEMNIDIAVVTSTSSIIYYTGNEIVGEATLLVEPDGSSELLSLAYDEYNFASADPSLPVRSYPYSASGTAVLAARLSELSGRIGVETFDLPASAWEAIVDTVGRDRLQAIDEPIADQRVVKSSEELEHIRTASAITHQALRTAQELLRERVAESELAAEIYKTLLTEGSEHMASQPYVKSGDRARLTHARWSDRIIDPTDHVLLEFAACAHRYHAPLMRTRTASRSDTDYRATIAAVLAGRDAYSMTLRPGIPARDLHDAYIEALGQRGMRKRNQHACGYSVGVGSAPTWAESSVLWVNADTSRTLQEGMVLHLISGLTDAQAGIPHVGLSELVLITKGGYERLLDFPDFLN